MLWDDYFVAAEPSQAPRLVSAPKDQSVTMGGNALFLVVVDTDLPVTYQWQFNGANIAGASNAVLRLNNVTFSQTGGYSGIVSNSAGVVVAGPATLQVTDLPNLAFYTPAGWSDKLVVATNLDSVTDATGVTSAQDIYVNWAVANTSASGDVLFPFYTQLYVDGLLSQIWPVASLAAGQKSTVKNYLLGKLP